jgi:hypothetical protein
LRGRDGNLTGGVPQPPRRAVRDGVKNLHRSKIISKSLIIGNRNASYLA